MAEVDIGKALIQVGLVIPRHRKEIELLVEFGRCGKDRELLRLVGIGKGLNRLWFVRRGREIESFGEVQSHKEVIHLVLPFERCGSRGKGLARLGPVSER